MKLQSWALIIMNNFTSVNNYPLLYIQKAFRKLPFISFAEAQFWNLISKDLMISKLNALTITWSGPGACSYPGRTSPPPKQEGFPPTDNVLNKPKSTACRTVLAKANRSTCKGLSGGMKAGTDPGQRSSPALHRRHFLMTMINFLLTKAWTGQVITSNTQEAFKNKILWQVKCNFRWILEAIRSSSNSRKHIKLFISLEASWWFSKCWENKEL